MNRSGAFLGAIALVFGLAPGCFSDPTSDETCTPGMEGCACVDLQCEDGLTCSGGVCVSPGGSSGGMTSTTPTTGDPTTGGTSTTSDPTTTDPTTTTTPTTGGGDSSSSGDPTEDGSSSGGVGDECGDFMVGPTEECDGGNGCSDTCELEVHECNPLNNVPCPADFKCSWELLMPEPFTGYFTCLPLADAPLAEGEGDCFEMNESQDQLCELGLACFNATFLEGCDVNGCCTPYCDVNDDAPCSADGYTCVAEPDLAPGLAFLGVCRPG